MNRAIITTMTAGMAVVRAKRGGEEKHSHRIATKKDQVFFEEQGRK